MKRPVAITASIIIISILICLVLLMFFSIELFSLFTPTTVEGWVTEFIPFVFFLAPLVVDLIFLLLRRYWAHILNLVIIGTLIALYSVASVFVLKFARKRFETSTGILFMAVSVGLLARLFVACLQVPRKTSYFMRKNKAINKHDTNSVDSVSRNK
jgi:hypothetical protein